MGIAKIHNCATQQATTPQSAAHSQTAMHSTTNILAFASLLSQAAGLGVVDQSAETSFPTPTYGNASYSEETGTLNTPNSEQFVLAPPFRIDTPWNQLCPDGYAPVRDKTTCGVVYTAYTQGTFNPMAPGKFGYSKPFGYKDWKAPIGCFVGTDPSNG